MLGVIVRSKNGRSKEQLPESLVMGFCREENMTLSDFIKIEATKEILYEYPLLFDLWDVG